MPVKKAKVKALAINDKVQQLKNLQEQLQDNQKVCELAFTGEPALWDLCRKQAAKTFEEAVSKVLGA